MHKGLAPLVSLFVLVALLWLGQFRFAWHLTIEVDRFAGASYSQVTTQLGKPSSERVAARRGYENEPRAEFNRVVVYQPLWGQLLLYFQDNRCVGSVFWADTVRF